MDPAPEPGRSLNQQYVETTKTNIDGKPRPVEKEGTETNNLPGNLGATVLLFHDG